MVFCRWKHFLEACPPSGPAPISACPPHSPTGQTGWRMSLQGLVGSLGAGGVTEQSNDQIMNRAGWMILGK